jgi:hypothetical protein
MWNKCQQKEYRKTAALQMHCHRITNNLQQKKSERRLQITRSL